MAISWRAGLENHNHADADTVSDLIERRREARFKLEVEIKIHSKSCGTVKGRTADVSESGISAVLNAEVPVGELVELDFTLPLGQVTIYAAVRERRAFRYGFQFVESNFIDDVIRPTCRVLAMEQYVSGGV
jgi:c-di-GMP-binding flagellar brake protein YcgR